MAAVEGVGEGGTVIVGTATDFSGFNPITNSSIDTDQLLKYALFTPLIQYSADLEPQPYLAESWEMHGDTAVTFTLRPDVLWHDGEPVTSEDVKFTFDMAKTPETGSLIGSAYLGSVESAEVEDPRTITFRFTVPARAGHRGLLVGARSQAPARRSASGGDGERAVQPGARRKRAVPVRGVAGERPAGAGAERPVPRVSGGSPGGGTRGVPGGAGAGDAADGARHRRDPYRHPAAAGPDRADREQRESGAARVQRDQALLPRLEQ